MAAICLLLAATSAVVPSIPARGQALGAWVERNGGSSKRVVVGPTTYGLGLMASEALRAGDVCVSLPPSCVLGKETCSGEAVQQLHEAIPDNFWSARTGVLLLAERAKGDASPFADYVKALPAVYTVPLFWPAEAIRALKYPTIQQRVLQLAKFVQAFAAEELGSSLAADAFAGVGVGADALGWAIAASSSRAFKIREQRVLCPLIDIGNHASRAEANCEVRGTQGGAVELVAVRDIALGEECTFCYGQLSNDDFLLDYGFLPAPPNADDEVALAWGEGELLASAVATSGAGGAPELQRWQKAALRAALPPGLETVKVVRGGVDARAMAACRIAIASDAAVLRKAAGGERPLPAGGEVRALKVAAAMVAIALTGFPQEEEGSEADGGEGSRSGGKADDSLTDPLALATRFMAEKQALCTHALGALGGRIRALQTGDARGELRGLSKPKPASGVRKKSARSGGAGGARPKASGFGS